MKSQLLSCAKGGTVSLPGVYGGLIDKVPMGAAFGWSGSGLVGGSDGRRGEGGQVRVTGAGGCRLYTPDASAA
ncbi:hypothetical protein [Deinococcus sp. ME38]|uniref:hypothetical protein n=1 Tax=Deinococcus sp. ME38 TaxID=3400344 RepID=UPI003B596DA1